MRKSKLVMFTEEDLENVRESSNGILEVKIEGYSSNPENSETGQIWLEMYKGDLQVHVWNGEEDPTTIHFHKVTH